MQKNQTVTIYGAYGHTGRFVVSELLNRGSIPILSGRDSAKLEDFGKDYPELEIRPASIDDPASLDKAIIGAAAIINCAGPFLDTAAPVIEAAIRARIHYLDVTAEQTAALAVFEHYADAAQKAGVVLIPAMAFYGGLSDILATAAMGDWTTADEIRIAVALDSWKPTLGTRLTGKRNTARRLIFSNNKLEFLADPPPTIEWDFPQVFGKTEVISLPFTEIITISSHLQASEIQSFINLAPLADIRNPETPEPQAADESGRSAQIFLMDVIVRRQNHERRATAHGRDIYAVTAPIIVEALERILDGRFNKTGVASAGGCFDAESFLESLSPKHLSFEISDSGSGISDR